MLSAVGNVKVALRTRLGRRAGAVRSEVFLDSFHFSGILQEKVLPGNTQISMRTRITITISLPRKMAQQVEKTMQREHRTRSELFREAFRTYLGTRRFPEETPTPSELRAIRRGEAAIKRGDYITLDELRREETLARRPRRARAKSATSIKRRTSTTY